MKKLITAYIFIHLVLLLGCNNGKVTRPDTSTNTAHLMKFHIDHQNYSEFQSLFHDRYQDVVSREKFAQLGNISTAGASYKNYELLTFENGEMLLVEFAPKAENERLYKIVNVHVVPEEMKAFFED